MPPKRPIPTVEQTSERLDNGDKRARLNEEEEESESEEEEVEEVEDEEEEGEQKEEVTETTHNLPNYGDVKITVYLSNECVWNHQNVMKTVIAQCHHEGKKIAGAVARYVFRSGIVEVFWESLEEPSRELADLGFDLFDRYGRLRREFIKHPVRQGSGIWGEEMDVGSLLLIEDILVDKPWRRRGVGKLLVEALIGKKSDVTYTMVRPGLLFRDLDDREEANDEKKRKDLIRKAADIGDSFYRNVGFRRVGCTSWLAFASDKNHLSHTLDISNDYNPVDKPEYEDESVVAQAYPLMCAAETLSDEECVSLFQSRYDLNECVDLGNEMWTKQDKSNRNVLHAAASKEKAKTIAWLLEHDTGDRLARVRNLDGYTPLEYFESQLDLQRTQKKINSITLTISDEFEGYSDNKVECLRLLRGIQTPITLLQQRQLKFGCTCGTCIQGILSPRMHLALLYQAEGIYDMMRDDMDILQDDMGDWAEWNDHLLQHVAPDLKRAMSSNKSVRQGFANLFDHIATTLRTGALPTIEAIAQTAGTSNEWPPHTRRFCNNGGTIECVLSTLFDSTKDQCSILGDGDHEETFGDEIVLLPECRNDYEYGFVERICGGRQPQAAIGFGF